MVAGQESWEKEDTRINVDGYKWFGKPRSSRREGEIGFLVRECLGVSLLEECYSKLRGTVESGTSWSSKDRVGKLVDSNDVFGMFGEDTC